jgi:hypothetical protein
LGFEFFVFSSLENTDNRNALAAVWLVVQVGLGELDGRTAFGRGGSASNPDEDGVYRVNNENVTRVEALAVEWDFSDLEGSRGIRNLHDAFLVSEVSVVSSFSGGLDGLLSSEELPEEISMGVLVVISEDEDFDFGSTLVVNGTGQLSGGGLFSSSCSGRLESVELKSNVKDEHVTHVEGVSGSWDLANNGLVQLSFDVEETRLVFLGLYVLESGFNTTRKNFELVEELEERGGFASLDFTELNWQAT